MSRFHLSRRTFLRGTAAGSAVCLGLPTLEAMLNTHGEALADGSSLPRRFGIWFWGNGVKPRRWIPDGTGTSWTPKTESAPLDEVRSKITIVSGTECPASGGVHHSGTSGMLCGGGATADGSGASVYPLPTIDVTIAQHLAADGLPFNRLSLAVTQRSEELGIPGNISYDGTSFNPAEKDPVALFDRLVGAGLPSTDSGSGTDPEAARRARARLLLLDAIKEDQQALRQRLGSADRARLDSHLEGVLALQRRLEALTSGANSAACASAVRPEQVALDDANMEERHQLLTRVLALALACDMTRTFTYQFSTWHGPIYSMLGHTEDLHTLTHDEPGDQPQVHEAIIFIMDQLRHFVAAFDEVQEGAGTLLDNCAILATSGVSEGASHSKLNMPIVVAGSAGGALRTGQHLAGSGSSYGVHVALMRALGLPEATFGAARRAVSEPLPGLLA